MNRHLNLLLATALATSTAWAADPAECDQVRFADVGPGLDRHLYCNFSVTPELLRRIDRELERPSPPR